ncbi:MAG TPA: outer membrane beta-barrel protein, partial [Flavobacteriaceae bacterium]|nr:outer membrane beta-barrel protein [Flavobacteriaceae bacterium]
RNDVDNVKEFSVENKRKFIRHTTEIEVTKNNADVNTLSKDRSPVFETRTVFLEVLFDAEKSLYSYRDNNKMLFFFSTSESETVTPLIYKKYLRNDGRISENNEYKQQLLNLLNCPALSTNDFQKATYKKQVITGLFITYYACKEQDYVSYGSSKKLKVHFNLRAGMNMANFSFNPPPQWEIEKVSQMTFRIGAEFEFVLPFNNNKWSALFEPSYSYFSSDFAGAYYVTQATAVDVPMTADYSAVDLPVGLRHYMYLNEDQAVFLNLLFSVNLTMNNGITRENYITEPMELGASSTNLIFGAGYRFMDRYSIEVRYNLNRNIPIDIEDWSASYGGLSFILGYRIF